MARNGTPLGALQPPMTGSTSTSSPAPTRTSDWSDDEVVGRVLAGDVELFAVLMRRHNRRVFRAVRGIVKGDAEAEDVAQEAWIAAYRALSSFESRAAFSTWLTRIAIRRALTRVSRARPLRSLDELDHLAPEDEDPGPEWTAHRREMARVLEAAIDSLPPSYRVVIMLRDVEHMSTAEAAQALGVSEENLRVRLHRARGVLRERLVDELGLAAVEAFGFDGERCDRMVDAVLGAITRTGV